MKTNFEHHSQKVLPFPEFLLRLVKYFLFASTEYYIYMLNLKVKQDKLY
jgi:hypothetical protein